MLAYKGFDQGLNCRGYQFVMGLNVTEKANCQQNGFHCAANPLDCLYHYPDVQHSEYYLVDASGDLDEDNIDSKISCTELTILRRLDLYHLILHGLAYMHDHPLLPWSSMVRKNRAVTQDGYVVVRGDDPMAKGGLGDILALAREDPGSHLVEEIALTRVDGETIRPDTWYGVDWKVRSGL